MTRRNPLIYLLILFRFVILLLAALWAGPFILVGWLSALAQMGYAIGRETVHDYFK